MAFRLTVRTGGNSHNSFGAFCAFSHPPVRVTRTNVLPEMTLPCGRYSVCVAIKIWREMQTSFVLHGLCTCVCELLKTDAALMCAEVSVGYQTVRSSSIVAYHKVQ